MQWGPSNGLNRRWLFTQNDDTSWNMVSLSSWKALDTPASNAANGIALIQWTPTCVENQRWWMGQQSDGSYKIWNKATTSWVLMTPAPRKTARSGCNGVETAATSNAG